MNQQAWWMAEHSTSEIAVRGCRIRLMRGGAGDPLVYLHGASGASWLPFLQTAHAKIRRHRAGTSGLRRERYAGLARYHSRPRLFSISTSSIELKIKSAHLVGNSLGGWLAAETRGAQYASRLASVTLCNAAGLYVPGAKQSDSFLMSEEERLRRILLRSEEGRGDGGARMHPDREDTVLKNRATVAKLSWQPRSPRPALPKWLHRIDVPTLIHLGRPRQVVPQGARAGLPQSDCRRAARDDPEMRPRSADREARRIRRRAGEFHQRAPQGGVEDAS